MCSTLLVAGAILVALALDLHSPQLRSKGAFSTSALDVLSPPLQTLKRYKVYKVQGARLCSSLQAISCTRCLPLRSTTSLLYKVLVTALHQKGTRYRPQLSTKRYWPLLTTPGYSFSFCKTRYKALVLNKPHIVQDTCLCSPLQASCTRRSPPLSALQGIRLPSPPLRTKH